MKNSPENVLNIVSTTFGGPSKSVIKKWLDTSENEKNQEDKLFGESLKYFVKFYKKEVKEIFDAEVINKNFYNKNIQEKLLEVLSEKHNQNYKDEMRERDSQTMAKDFLDENENSNVVVTLPTGVGKTYISFNEIEKSLKKSGKIFFAVPTNDLVKEQYNQFLDYIYMRGIDIKTDLIKYLSNEKNKEIESSDKVVFLTHHMLENISENEDLDDSSLIIIDEIHVGEEGGKQKSGYIQYPSFNAYENFKKKGVKPRIIGLTAFSKQQNKVVEKFDIENWFVGSRKKDYNHREYLRHDLISEDSLETKEFRDVQSKINTVRKYLVEQLNNLIFNVYKDDLSFPEDLGYYFKKNNLLSKTYIENDYEKDIRRYFRKRWENKFTKEFYHNHLLNYLISKLKIVNQIKKSFENDDYFIAKKKLEDFYNILTDELLKYKEKNDNYKFLPDLDNYNNLKKYTYSMEKIVSFLKSWSYMLFAQLYGYEKDEKLHPKIQKTFDIVEENKVKGEPTIVFVENKEVIKKLMQVSQDKGYNAGYIVGGKRGKKDQLINSYIKHSIKNKSMDVVFVTSVMKLGVNFDINELVLYNNTQNEKDLLQFAGRVGRFKKGGRIHFVYPKNTLEWYRLNIVNKAQRELQEQFNEGERIWNNWLDYQNKSDTSRLDYSSYVGHEETKKRGIFDINKDKSEHFIKNFYDGDLIDGEEVYGRFKIFEIKSHKENLTLELEIGDSSSENTIKVFLKGFSSKGDMKAFKSRLGFDKYCENIYKINGLYDTYSNAVFIDVSNSGGRIVDKCEIGTYDIKDYEIQGRLI